MSKFNVGDRVVITQANSWGDCGDIGAICYADTDGPAFPSSYKVLLSHNGKDVLVWIPEWAMDHMEAAILTTKAKESDRKEVAKAIREIQECLNEALKECQVVGIDVSLSVEGLELKVDMTHTPEKRSY